MMKRLGLLFVCSLLTTIAMAGKIGEWKSYFAYGVSTQMEKQGDEVFAFAGDAIFSVNTQSGEIGRYDKQAGLSGRTINRIAYNESTQTLLIGYADGLLDFRDKNGEFYALPDLQTKDLSVNKQINHVLMVGDLAYCAMNFGVMVVNMRKREIADTYHLASDTAYLCATAIVGDSIFAISSSKMYVAALKDNLLDFGMWHVSTPITKTGKLMALAAQNDQLYLIKDSVLYVRKGVQWQVMNDQTSFLNIRNHGGLLYFVSKEGIFSLQNDRLSLIHYTQGAVDILPASEGYWMIENNRSIIFNRMYNI